MKLLNWCNRTLVLGYLALFGVVPLILTPWNYELFEFNKMITVYAITIIVTVAFVIKNLLHRRIVINTTLLFPPLLFFIFTQLISSLFSMDPHVSWFGYYSRFNGGMFSLLCYVLLYIIFVSAFRFSKESTDDSDHTIFLPIHRLLLTIMSSITLVALWGVAERLGVDKNWWVQDVQSRVFSTLGQPNWLAAVLCTVMPIGLFFTVIHEKTNEKLLTPRRLVGIGFTVLCFMVLIFTRSRSGFGGFLVASGLFFAISAWLAFQAPKHANSDDRSSFTPRQLGIRALPIGLLLFGFALVHGTHIEQIDRYLYLPSIQARLSPKTTTTEPVSTPTTPTTDTLLTVGGTASTRIRQYVWQGAIKAWLSSPKVFLIGTGTETFAFAFFQHKPIEHNLTSEWDFLYNKAHNEYLNYLTTTGIVGLGSYLVLLIVMGASSVRVITKTSLPFTQRLLVTALFSGWVSILITNGLGFSVVVTQLYLFLIPGIIPLLGSKPTYRIVLSVVPQHVAAIIGTITAIGGVVGIYLVATYWFADLAFAAGYRYIRTGQLPQAYQSLSLATSLRPGEPLFYDELSVLLATMALGAVDAGNATAASTLAEDSIAASNIALSISPNNVNFWKSRTKVYFTFSPLESSFTTRAIESLEKAYSLSPYDPKITYNLAVLYGRLGENERAIDLLTESISLKPNYRDAYVALSIFYEELNQPHLAKAILEEYIQKVDPNDTDFLNRLKEL